MNLNGEQSLGGHLWKSIVSKLGKSYGSATITLTFAGQETGKATKGELSKFDRINLTIFVLYKLTPQHLI